MFIEEKRKFPFLSINAEIRTHLLRLFKVYMRGISNTPRMKPWLRCWTSESKVRSRGFNSYQRCTSLYS